MENEKKTKPTVYEQDMWKMQREKTWLFSSPSLSKIVPLIFFAAIAIWNINAYIDGKQADAFVDIYNPNIEIIAEDMASIWENFQKAGGSFFEIEKNPTMDESEVKELMNNAQQLLASNTALYERVVQAVTTLEDQACTLLTHASAECLAFVWTYREIVSAFSDDTFDSAARISDWILEKSDQFMIAVKKDNIEF